jgi:outer membrane protein OmpA-like peptidoglycan-associated protein
VRYDNKVNVEVNLTKDKAIFLNELRHDGLAGYGGGTAILEGTAEGIRHLASNASTYSERYAVVFTDGQENASKISREKLIELSLQNRTPIIAVDFGNRINEGYMRSLAEATGGSYYHIYLTDEFDLLFEDIYKRSRNAYVIEYPTKEFGTHKVRVKVCVGKGSASDTASYDNSPQVGTVALIDVHFDVAKSTIRDESKPAIKEVVDLMNRYPNMTIELQGHTDSTNSTGDPQYNQKLSQSRAEAVRDAMIASGIKASRIIAKGYGESMPVATNKTPEGRQKNRRTEFVILSR